MPYYGAPVLEHPSQENYSTSALNMGPTSSTELRMYTTSEIGPGNRVYYNQEDLASWRSFHPSEEDYTVCDTVYHECYGEGIVTQIDNAKDAAYFVEFKKYIAHFKTNKYWCTKTRLSENPYVISAEKKYSTTKLYANIRRT